MAESPRASQIRNNLVHLSDDVARIAKCVVSPGGSEVIAILLNGPRDVKTLTRMVDLAQSAISKRLAPMRRAKVVVEEEVGSRHIYRLHESVEVRRLGEHCVLTKSMPWGYVSIGIREERVAEFAELDAEIRATPPTPTVHVKIKRQPKAPGGPPPA